MEKLNDLPRPTGQVMRGALLMICLLAVNASVFAQSEKEILAEIEGKYTVGEDGNVTYTKIIEGLDLTKDEIYDRAHHFALTYKYIAGETPIQVQDKENGQIVVKGLYRRAGMDFNPMVGQRKEVDANHILRIDIKDNRLRVITTLTQYHVHGTDTHVGAGFGPPRPYREISAQYPINPKGGDKRLMLGAFYQSYKRTMEIFDTLEKLIREGAAPQQNDDW